MINSVGGRLVVLVIGIMSFGLTVGGASSPRTAHEVLAQAEDYKGKEVTLEVLHLRSVRWRSPSPDLHFFRAVTLNKRKARGGGHILIAVKAEESKKFAKKYGLGRERKNRRTKRLKGTLLFGHRKAINFSKGRKLSKKRQRHTVWFIDASDGIAEKLLEERGLVFEDEEEKPE